MTHIDVDSDGYPVLLAEVVVEPDVTTPPPLIPPARPATVRHGEWERRVDAARSAAREFEQLSDQDLRERLKGTTSRPLADQEVTDFRAEVRAQQMRDLVDILDNQELGRLRARRTVRVMAPRGYVRRTINALDDQELGQLVGRLKARGFTDKHVKSVAAKHLGGRDLGQLSTQLADDDPQQQAVDQLASLAGGELKPNVEEILFIRDTSGKITGAVKKGS